MGQIGRLLYDNRPLPKGWEEFTPEEAGFNAVKQALYYALLRKMDRFTENVAAKLYNVYCFGYAIEINEKKMIWPEDLKKHTKLSEEETIKNDPELVESLKQGSKDAKNKKGRLIG